MVQLYVSRGGSGDAIRQLRGFKRVHLRAGETREVEFEIPAEDLPASKVRISVGGEPAGSVARVEGSL